MGYDFIIYRLQEDARKNVKYLLEFTDVAIIHGEEYPIQGHILNLDQLLIPIDEVSKVREALLSLKGAYKAPDGTIEWQGEGEEDYKSATFYLRVDESINGCTEIYIDNHCGGKVLLYFLEELSKSFPGCIILDDSRCVLYDIEGFSKFVREHLYN